MDQHVFTTLEYDEIKERLYGHALSYFGRKQVEELSPVTDIRQIKAWLGETEEALRVIAGSSSVPIPTMEGIELVLQALGKGHGLTVHQIEYVERFLEGTTQLRRYMDRKLELAPKVASYAQSLQDMDYLREEIRRSVQLGEVVDSASDELHGVRKRIGVLEERVRRKLETALHKYQKYLQENFYSQRNERWVIPVKRDSKRLVPGVVLDESASGQTVFIEPAEIAAQQEELAEARYAEQREVARVLGHLTSLIEQHRESLIRNMEVAGHYDFLFAKAKLAKTMNGRSVVLNSSGLIRLCGARHPLLGSDAVPLDVQLGGDTRALIITGPNTGGKTVTLKTIGLLTLMAQSGLLVPVEKGCELSVFHQVLADIGDGQSIQQSLSTFSSHVTNVICILQQAGPGSLVLLDELAAGTDPGEGVGLAIAVLESLYQKGATVVASTHFNEIKHFAKVATGFMNARMEFDMETLRPLFRLQMGEAGDSYALAIAERLGIPNDIVERARAVVAGSSKGSAHDGGSLQWADFSSTSPQSPAAPTVPPDTREKVMEKGAQDEVQRGFLKGDRVWIHTLKRSGIVMGPADDRGNVIVMVKNRCMIFNHKRIAPYLTREVLYPDFPNYDLDIVLESKDTRRKRKIMTNRHVDGLSIEHSPNRVDQGEYRND